MGQIEQQILIHAPPERVYDAISQPEALARWWTRDVSGEPGVGSTLELGFYNREIVTRFRIEELYRASRVRWRYLDGPPELVSSVVIFELNPGDENTTVVYLRHALLDGNDAFLAHARESWQRVLHSLKSYVETGAGIPISD